MHRTAFLSLATGIIYDIDIDDEGEKITVSQNGESVGSISLSREDDHEYLPATFRIRDLSLEAIRRQGVGRQCLMFHKECFGAAIHAGPIGGFSIEDNSRLIGDGPGFIFKMREEDIVKHDSDSFPDENV